MVTSSVQIRLAREIGVPYVCPHEVDTNGHHGRPGSQRPGPRNIAPEWRGHPQSSRERRLAPTGLRPRGRDEPGGTVQYRARKAKRSARHHSQDCPGAPRPSGRDYPRVRRAGKHGSAPQVTPEAPRCLLTRGNAGPAWAAPTHMRRTASMNTQTVPTNPLLTPAEV